MKIKIYGKTADAFSMRVKEEDGSTVLDYNSYPPTGHGFSRDGDSIELTIDNETGVIQGWKPLTNADIEELNKTG